METELNQFARDVCQPHNLNELQCIEVGILEREGGACFGEEEGGGCRGSNELGRRLRGRS